MAGTMRTAVALAILLAALTMASVLVAAAALRAPSTDLAARPPVDAYCDDAFTLRASGTLTWLSLEGGMWEFNAGGALYDLAGVERFLPSERLAWLQGHAGTGIPATVEGVAEPCLATIHMRGIVVRVTEMEA
ncbi:MAG: hypothetical protein A3K65_08065 [Euryarchaeota archaeon RBG_16_68_12]|nr:MAG: hypothetical protein A3K65_08065 [Euryarchaeota archaeon RBG_16_68_12]